VPYTISLDTNGQRNIKYKINTQKYGLIDIYLTIYIRNYSDFSSNAKLTHVGIENMDTNDYVLEISFRVEANNLGSYPTLGGTQSASIMATNRDAINELVQEKHEKGFRLIMIYSQPITDNNDSNRRYAFRDLKSYISNRNVSEREIKDYTRIKKKLDEYYEDTKELILYTPSYKFTDDETKVYGTDGYSLASSFDPNKYFIFLSMYDNEFSLRNLTEKVKQELTAKLNNEPSKFELHKGILEKTHY